jgi:Amt family ammonium transporter
VAAVNTGIAGAFGLFASMLWIMKRTGKPDPGMIANGLLAGLVGITAPCAFVDPWAAAVIGIISGVLVIEAVFFIERRGIDDPVGAVAVHGVCGAWGVIAVGLFAATDLEGFWKKGLFYGGGFDQLGPQLVGVAAITAFVGVAMGIIFLAIKATIGLRVSEQEEVEGLDVHEHGYPGYSDDIAFAGTVSGTDLVN